MKPTVSVIVRTYNEERYLSELLESIKAQQIGDDNRLEIILVDSGSTDRTLEIANATDARIVKIKKEEFSFGRSLNIGCEAAQGDYLIFISGHCIPKGQEWLAELIRPFDNPKVAITYGRQIGAEETKFSEHRIFLKYFPDSDEPSQGEIFCNNANAALRKSVWCDNQFDEKLTGLEDMAMAKEVVALGMNVEYARRSVVYHLHHETWRQVKNRYEREAIALESIFPSVQLDFIDSLRYFLVAFFADISIAITERCMLRELWSILAFRFSQFYGAWRGHRQHRNLSRQEKERYFYPN